MSTFGDTDSNSRGRKSARQSILIKEIVALLSGTELFGGLDTADLMACAAAFRAVRFAKGELLFTRGDPGTHLYLVAEGRVRLATASREGRELSFRHAVAGDLFGELAALDGGGRSAGAAALTPVRAYALPRTAFHKLWSTRPKIADKMVAFLCRRIRETSTQLEGIVLHPLHVRLARLLLIALGNRQAVPGKRVPLELGFPQGELAQLLGASRSKVNAALGALEAVGAIKRTSDRLFCDPVKLGDFARQDDA
jgi:CRP/FNR family transcriptional regulator, cyclic AMP receptor protein